MRFSTAVTTLSTVSVTFAATFAAHTEATPSESCRPGLDGIGVSIISHGIEWDMRLGRAPTSGSPVVNSQHRGMLLNADFKIEADGENDFVIVDIGAPQLRVTAQDSELILFERDSSDDSQFWSISCDTCYSNIQIDQRPKSAAATGCAIISAFTGDCVETSGKIGDPLYLAPCDGSERQTFELRPPTRSLA